MRLAERGAPPELRVEVRSRYHSDDMASYNVVAEIPGTDPVLKEQIVLIGAHLDSWHASNGATDNADGAVGAMEAMRILSALQARPRRTIRIVLWGGEEQGLLGSRAYVQQHFADAASRSRLAVFLNDDPGTGPSHGFFMQGNTAAKAILDAWLDPLRDLGARRNILEGIGNTDHVPFDEEGCRRLLRSRTTPATIRAPAMATATFPIAWPRRISRSPLSFLPPSRGMRRCGTQSSARQRAALINDFFTGVDRGPESSGNPSPLNYPNQAT